MKSLFNLGRVLVDVTRDYSDSMAGVVVRGAESAVPEVAQLRSDVIGAFHDSGIKESAEKLGQESKEREKELTLAFAKVQAAATGKSVDQVLGRNVKKVKITKLTEEEELKNDKGDATPSA